MEAEIRVALTDEAVAEEEPPDVEPEPDPLAPEEALPLFGGI